MIIKNVVKEAGLWGIDQEISFPLITKSGMNQHGKVIHYYFNYGVNPMSFEYLYKQGLELLTDKTISANELIDIEPWGIKIIEEI